MSITKDNNGTPDRPEQAHLPEGSIPLGPAVMGELPAASSKDLVPYDQFAQKPHDESDWWAGGADEFDEVANLDKRMDELGFSRETIDSTHLLMSKLLDKDDMPWGEVKLEIARYLSGIVDPDKLPWREPSERPFNYEKPIDAPEERAAAARQAVKESPKQPEVRRSTKTGVAMLLGLKLGGLLAGEVPEPGLGETAIEQSAGVVVDSNVVHGNAGEWSESLPNFEETQALVDGVLETFRSAPDGSNPSEPQLAGEDIVLVDDRVYMSYLLRSRPMSRIEAANYISDMDPEVLTLDEYDQTNVAHVALVTVAKVNRGFRAFVGDSSINLEDFADPIQRGSVLRRFGEYLDLTGELSAQGFAQTVEDFSNPTNRGLENVRNPHPIIGAEPTNQASERTNPRPEAEANEREQGLPTSAELAGMLEALTDNPRELAQMILSSDNIDYKAAVEGNDPMRTRDALRYIVENGEAYHGLTLVREGEFVNIPVNPQMLKVLAILANNGINITLTAINDGEHAETSLHYTEEAAAFDIAIIPAGHETMTDVDIARGIAIRDWLYQNKDIFGLEELLFTPNGDTTNNILNGQTVQPGQEVDGHFAHLHVAFNSALIRDFVSPVNRLANPVIDEATEQRIAELLNLTDGFALLIVSDLMSEAERFEAYVEGVEAAATQEAAQAAEPAAPVNPEFNIDNLPPPPNQQIEPELWQQIKNIYREHSVAIEALAAEAGVEPAVAGGILSVESGGEGFWEDGSLKIRFEPHEFIRVSGDNGVFISDEARAWFADFAYRRDDLGQTGSSDEYVALEYASAINEEIAHQTISMGGPQIMGYHAERLGYGSAIEMFQDFAGENGEAEQLIALGRFILTDQRLVDAANAGDWDTFASIYNGPDYRDNNYQNKLPTAARAYSYIYQAVHSRSRADRVRPVVVSSANREMQRRYGSITLGRSGNNN